MCLLALSTFTFGENEKMRKSRTCFFDVIFATRITDTHSERQTIRQTPFFHSFPLSAGKLQSKIKRNRFVASKLSLFSFHRCIVLLCQQQQQQLWWTYFSLGKTAFSTTTNKARINLHVIRVVHRLGARQIAEQK